MKKSSRTADFVHASFGLAVPKQEGEAIAFDPGADPSSKRGVGNDWMEIPVPKNAGRARVHKMVDEWLDQRALGFRAPY